MPNRLLDHRQAVALAVEQPEGDRGRDVHHDLGGAALAALLLDGAQHREPAALDAADQTAALAVRAGDEGVLHQRRAQPLARHLEQAEMADPADLDARAVLLQRVLQAALDHAVVLARLHVDEVDDDQPRQVAQAKLARHLVGGLEVGAQRRVLDVAVARGAARVHVDGDQRLGLVDDDVAPDLSCTVGLCICSSWGVDAVAGEDRHRRRAKGGSCWRAPASACA
jgi:hypothetical protein